MDWFRIFLDVRDSLALVVGGGTVALRKTHQLLEAGCKMSVVAPEFSRNPVKFPTQMLESWRTLYGTEPPPRISEDLERNRQFLQVGEIGCSLRFENRFPRNRHP